MSFTVTNNYQDSNIIEYSALNIQGGQLGLFEVCTLTGSVGSTKQPLWGAPGTGDV